jgi:hypothetical protein
MPRNNQTTCLKCAFALTGLALLAVAATVAMPAAASDTAQSKTEEETRELDRARREIKLLDDIYKTAIVLITKHYVEDDNDLPAGEAFKVLFAGVKEKGWHEVRLLDATGEPLSEANAPQDDFEKNAIKALLAGKTYYEEQAEKDGKRYLRAATPIPIVLEKCTMCHSNYKDQKVIGALGYSLPLDVKAAAR